MNQDNWPLMQPLLANPALRPVPADISLSTAMLQELLQIRYSSPLFRLATEQEVMNRVSFLNNGPNQLPGLIVMALSDEMDPDLDPARDLIVVLVNANDQAQTFSDASFVGKSLALHPVQANGVDAVVKTSAFDPATGAFTIPGRTTAVFTDGAAGLSGSVTQTASTSPVVPGTYIDVAVSVANAGGDIDAFMALAPIDPDTVYVAGSASGGATPLTAAEAAAKGMADVAAGRAPDAVVAVAWMGALPAGSTVEFGFQVRVVSSSGQVQHDVALFDGATLLGSLSSNSLTIVDNSAYPVSRSRRFNVARDTFINGAQPGSFYGSAQTMWTGFFGQMRPLVQTSLSGIPSDAYVDVAYLYLYIVEGRGFSNWANSVITVQAHQVTGDWMPAAVNWWTPWTTPGGDFGPALSSNHIGSGKLNTWLRLDVTDAVSDFLRGASNQGFIVANNDSIGVRYALATKEYFDASKIGYIRVYYRTAN